MKALIAKRSLRYHGRPINAGERFEATVSHARVLVAIGRARYAPAGALVTPAIVVQTPTGSPRHRRTYQRRDMRAED